MAQKEQSPALAGQSMTAAEAGATPNNKTDNQADSQLGGQASGQTHAEADDRASSQTRAKASAEAGDQARHQTEPKTSATASAKAAPKAAAKVGGKAASQASPKPRPKAAAQAAQGLSLARQRELAKVGMTLSLAVLVVTGFTGARKRGPSRTLHLAGGAALIGFSLWHHCLYGKPAAKPQENSK